jgi:hypothetical protein
MGGHAAQGEREELIADVQRLELELDRYRAHAERTSKLFLSVTNYAEKVREAARRDAELALRKATRRVEKLDSMTRDLERTELDLVAARDELARLETLTEETRARLSAFLTSGLEALNYDGATSHSRDDTVLPALDDLDATLREQLPSTSESEPRRHAQVDGPER